MKIQLKTIFGKLIFEWDEKKNTIKKTLLRAIYAGADLQYADLRSADLQSAENIDLVIAQTRIVGEGDLIVWKKCMDNVLVKLKVPAKAKRSNAFGRKCRAEYVKVLEVINAKVGISIHDSKTKYAVGEIVKCDRWDKDFTNECSGGIHFYLTKIEAENN